MLRERRGREGTWVVRPNPRKEGRKEGKVVRGKGGRLGDGR